MIDIRKMPQLLDTVNAILNNGKTAEVKRERNGETVTVVEQQRILKIKIETEK